MVDSIRQDIRYALRTMRVNPGFVSIAVLCLALGAGANTAMFQLFNAVALRTLPVLAPDQLVELRLDDLTDARGTWLRQPAVSNPIWEQLRRETDPFSGLFAWADETIDISTAGELRKATALWVSGDFFRVLGVQPMHGRLFSERDDRRGCGPDAGVVLSYGFWQHHFGGDPAVVGSRVLLGKMRPEVLGVTPPTFFGLEVGRTFDVAIPICAEPVWHGVNTRLDSSTVWWLTVMARLEPGVPIERAAAIVSAKSAAIFAATLPKGYPAASVATYLAMKLVTIPAGNGISRVRTQYSQPLALLLGTTGLVLLIACVNLAHLLLARATARSREIAVRLSLGASRLRLAQQLTTETMMVAAAGVAVGLMLARMLCRVLIAFLSADATNVFIDVSMDRRTFTFTVLLAVATAVVSASIPVWRMSRAADSGSLTRGGDAGIAAGRSGLRRALLASQIAISLALLGGTLLFTRSLRNLQTVDAGFERRGVVVAEVNFSDVALASDGVLPFRGDLLERIRANPMVAGAAEVGILPIAGGNWNNRVWMDDSDADHARVVMRNMIGTDYFRTLKTTLIAGRAFENGDMTPSASKVAIVNERFARAFGLGARPIGRHLWIETTPLEPSAAYQIVGVAANTKYRDLREDDQPIMYVPLWQAALRRPVGQFVIRSNAPSDATLLSALRTTFERLDPNLRYSFRPFDDIVQRSLIRERLMAALAGPFGLLAVTLTALGLYGVFSYTVAQRRKEIGIRVALGADRRDVILPIVREAAVLLVFGLAAGASFTVVAGRAASTLLFGVTAYDPGSLAVASAVLACIALIATYVPARRAAGLDPAAALRQE